MPCAGAIEVVPGGFAVHLQAAKEQVVPTSAVDSTAMPPRQRFTLAHEICHTFFYDSSRKPVKPHPRPRLLEGLCNYGAQRLLLPDYLVEREIGVGRRFDSIEMAWDLVGAARVSIEVLLHRLNGLDQLKETDYALLTLRNRDDGGIVTTGFCLSGVFTRLQKPTLYAAPPKWVRRIAPELDSPTGTVHRSPHSDGWEFISRCVANKQSPGQVLVESRLDVIAERTIRVPD
jgi:hypothetical protein